MSSQKYGNSCYRSIQSFGTGSAFDPKKIQIADTSTSIINSPYVYTSINVPLMGLYFDYNNPIIIQLGSSLPSGTTVVSVSLNGNNSLIVDDTTYFTLALYNNTVPNGPPKTPVIQKPDFIIEEEKRTIEPLLFNASLLNLDTQIVNYGSSNISLDSNTSIVPIPENNIYTYPVLTISCTDNTKTSLTSLNQEYGTVNVKIVYYFP